MKKNLTPSQYTFLDKILFLNDFTLCKMVFNYGQPYMHFLVEHLNCAAYLTVSNRGKLIEIEMLYLNNREIANYPDPRSTSEIMGLTATEYLNKINKYSKFNHNPVIKIKGAK